MPLPTVSVVIPTYNRARFLPAAVASVRAQTYPCAEIVIVDDGSTDDTADVVAGLGLGIRYLRQANAGPAAARNKGIIESRGDLVALLDTDDQWLPKKIEIQVQQMAIHKEVALNFTDERIENRLQGTSIPSNFRRRQLLEQLSRNPSGLITSAPTLLLRINPISTSTVLAKREVLMNLGGFNTALRYGEDFELWLRIASRHTIGCIPVTLATRVTHGANTTSSIEPMLRGYVRTAEVIRQWGREQMATWGVSADHYVASCLADLGYWYFSQSRFAEARQTFRHSMREAPNFRAAKYLAACRIPGPLLNALRQVKGVF
jgi:glycosyltransferase involved in cell wall biosynthesis